MDKTILRSSRFIKHFHKQFCVLTTSKPTELQVLQNHEILDIETDLKAAKLAEEQSILAPCKEDISHFAPNLRPTFNFAAYVNKSETLKKLVQLGVDLHHIEKKKEAPELILKLEFEKDVKPYLFFLHDLGVAPDQFGPFITKNPFIFREDLQDLVVRINYLQSKRFDKDMIVRIVTKNPFWLNFSTQRIDNRLGQFQQNFKLNGSEVRALSAKQPRILTYNMNHIKVNTFSIKEEMGFNDVEAKMLLLTVPRLWMMSQRSITERFDYIHNTMKISHEQILKMPKILTARNTRMRQRHGFLVSLGRAQYDPTKQNYVSLQKLIEGSDAEFSVTVAKSSVQAYNMYLKTL